MDQKISTVSLSPAFAQVLASPAPGQVRSLKADPLIKLLVPLLLALTFWMAYAWGSLGSYWQQFSSHTSGSLFLSLARAYALMLLALQLLRTFFWAAYRPYPLAQGPWPTLTIIMPAYNEGAMVEKAVAHVAASDYPADRLEIICIDDGSTDDTWEFIQRASRLFPSLVKAIRFPANRGKKEALYAGFSQGRGEIFITVDSDSVIEPQALRHLVSPLMQDDKIGAVAGNVKVFNRHQSFMGKMQGVRFINLDYLRAAQSWYRTVICTPGSLSAYRRCALSPILSAWRRQSFLGAPCRHSEDRALTNFILRAGYYTCYQRSAVVHTLVPETYRGVCNMYLRWERGNVRESCVQLSYLFTRYRTRHRLLPLVEFFLSQLEYPLAVLFFGLLLLAIAAHPAMIFNLLWLLALGSLANLIYYLWLERDLDFVYGVIYSFYAFFLLQWIYPYACATVRDCHWLTR
ncbi:MAG: glycosyltransferase family 2 protein [Desulfobaccales bacterium]